MDLNVKGKTIKLLGKNDSENTFITFVEEQIFFFLLEYKRRNHKNDEKAADRMSTFSRSSNKSFLARKI